MHKTLFGKEPAASVLNEIEKRIATLGRKPKLVIVQVGGNPASNVYVSMKIKKAKAIGMETELKKLPEEAKEKELLDLVESLNNDNLVDGFIVQLPLPKHMNAIKVIEGISAEKDVDGFTSTNMGKLFLGISEEELLLPATPSGIIKMLEFYNVSIKGMHAVIVGRSNIVGKPIASMLLNRHATVSICHSKTENLAEYTKQADILIVAVGKPEIITSEMVKENAVVIDVGTNRLDGKIKGDVDYENVIKKADCSPVPKGVGPMTVAMLLLNTIKAAEKRDND